MSRAKIHIVIKTLLFAFLLIGLPLVLQLKSGQIVFADVDDQCGSGSSCVLVCGDGTVKDFDSGGTRTADDVCSGHKGADLLAKAGSNHCDNKNRCQVVCDDGKSTNDFTVTHAQNDADYPKTFCKSHGGVKIIINPDGSTDAASQKSSNNSSANCDQNDAFSTCCQTNSTDPSTCVTQYCGTSKTICSDSAANCNGSQCNLIQKYLNPGIKLLSGLVGVVVVISLILGGIQYATSGGDPQKVTAAKNRITKTIVALVSYIFLYALVQFLVPGGVK